MKKLLTVLVLVSMVASSVLAVSPVKAASATTTIKIFIGKTVAYVNGTKTALDQPPVIINNRTMVPIRFVSENLKADVKWDSIARQVTISLLNNTAVLTIDQSTAQANGYTVYLDAPATIIKTTSRTIVPIRFVSDTIGADVVWNASEKSVTVTLNPDWLANPVQVSFWHAMQAALGTALNGLITEFNATHPRIKIVGTAVANYTGLQQKTVAALSGGDPPAVTQAYENWVAQYMLGNYLAPMKNFINGANGLLQNDINDYFQIMWQDGYMPDGKMWMMPFNKSTEVVYYNADMLKAYGYDSPPKTWDEFATMVKAMTKADGSQWGASAGADVDLWYAMINEWGGKVFTKDNSTVLFDRDANAIASVKFLNDLYAGKYIHFTTGYNYQTDFGNQKCCFTFASIASYTYMVAAAGGKFKVAEAPLPAGPAGQYGVMYGTNIVIFTKGYTKEQQDAAWTFVKWFTSPHPTAEWSIQTGYLPVRKSALNLPEMKTFIAAHPEAVAGFTQLSHCLVEPPTQQWNTARTDISNEMQKIFLQKISPEDGMKELGQKVRSYIGG
jgi:multiple sugar transport system substrate-binding protein